ncbi:MAG: transglycosylase domain-containing protein [Microthrixaceae bacterium]|nr:transglycosylase domain-containing protein [Microthrixaceae bacterium]
MTPKGTNKPKGTAAKGTKRRFIWGLRRVAYAVLVLAVVSMGGLWMALNTIDLPPAKPSAQTSFVCDSTVSFGDCDFDNSMAHLSAAEERVNVEYEDLPTVLVQAVLAAEDQKFFDHGGIDPMGIGRAVYTSLRGSSRSRQGGSTITQQYVKLTYLTSERTISRKLREAVLSIKLEGQLDKRDILTRYLNEIYFGRGAYGVEAASRAYFGIGVQNLKLHQAAYLAGLIRSPESADAVKDPKEATRRRATVLANMVKQGYITSEEADQANAVPWIWTRTDDDGNPQNMTVLPRNRTGTDLAHVRYSEIGSQYWMAEVRKQLRERFGTGAETRGLRVYTTFDPTTQRAAQDAVTKTLNRSNGPVGSLVAVDEKGRITAMVAGTDYSKSKVNLALGKRGGGSGRQPGSTFKPFALAAFIEDGYSIESPFRSPPTTEFEGVYNSPGKLWNPKNFGKADLGVLSVEEATWKSSNTVYAGMVNLVTPERLAEMARRLGVKSKLTPRYALVLGSEEVSVLDMASAYSTFADRGKHITPYMITRVEDSTGRVLFDASESVKATQVIDQGVADTVNWTLKGAIEHGTGTAARISTPAAGKTGTTTDSKDAWFVGYTCHLTAAVWMGYEQPRTMKDFKGREVSGGSFPADIWREFMSKATKGDQPCEFPQTDFGQRIVNQSLASKRTTTTTENPNGSTTTSTADGEGDSSTTSSPSTTQRPTPSTTSAPTSTTPPTSSAPATTAAPTTTAAAAGD